MKLFFCLVTGLLLSINFPFFSPAARSEEAVEPILPARFPAPEMKRLSNGDVQLGTITLHRQSRELSFPGKIILTGGVLEVLLSTPVGRLHESLVLSEASPLHLQTMLYLLGLHNGPRLQDPQGHQGSIVDIDLEWQNDDGQAVREPVESWIRDERTGQTMARLGWVFVGSAMQDGVFIAETTGNLALIYAIGDTILNIPDPSGDDDTVYVVNATKTKPGLNAPVRVIIKPRQID